jgi:TPR repeat protein
MRHFARTSLPDQSRSVRLIAAGLVALALSLGLAGPLAAGPVEDALEAYHRGDYATAIQLLRPPADQGDAIAQTNLGVMYNKGQGVPQAAGAAADRPCNYLTFGARPHP